MSEEKQQEYLNQMHEGLETIPEKYHADVAKSLLHDIGVIARTIAMVERKSAGAA